MKYILFLIVSCISLLSNPFNNAQKAVELAVEQNKLIFSIVVSDTCEHCSRQMYDIKNNKKLKSFLLKNYIILIMNVNKQEIPYFAGYDGITPTLSIIDTEGNTVTRMSGRVESEELYNYLKNINSLWIKRQNKEN